MRQEKTDVVCHGTIVGQQGWIVEGKDRFSYEWFLFFKPFGGGNLELDARRSKDSSEFTISLPGTEDFDIQSDFVY